MAFKSLTIFFPGSTLFNKASKFECVKQLIAMQLPLFNTISANEYDGKKRNDSCIHIYYNQKFQIQAQ